MSNTHWREQYYEKRRAELEKQYAERAIALDGIVRDASTRPDGVREITDFELHSMSLIPDSQALPSWRNLDSVIPPVGSSTRIAEAYQRRPPSAEGLNAAIRVLAGDLAAAHGVSIGQAEHDVRFAIDRLKEQNGDEQ
jgi:hypothetical protein